MSARSTTSRCRIGWLEEQGFFRDPCCGSSWTRDGIPIFGPALNADPLLHYEAEVTADGEILVYPWRDKPIQESQSC